MRFSLQVKQVTSPTGGGQYESGMNPAMMTRPASVQLDEGRPWAGDLYEEGPVSDPSQAYAHFQLDQDTEAWLDKAEDGTLIGWVREGDEIHRYANPETWALDVDGAQMQRVDAAPDPAAAAGPEGAPVDPAADPAAVEDPAMVDDPTADPMLEEPDPSAPTPTAPGQDPEVDPAAVEDPAADPAAVDGEDDEDIVNPFAVDDDEPIDPAAEVEDPTADPVEDPAVPPTDEPVDPAADEPAEDPAAADDDLGDEPAEASADKPEDEDDEDETEADKLFKGGQKKSSDPGIASGPARKPRGTKYRR